MGVVELNTVRLCYVTYLWTHPLVALHILSVISNPYIIIGTGRSAIRLRRLANWNICRPA